MTETLTPTEDLLLEVLAARYRLGEKLWTFNSNHSKALNSLSSKGYVDLMGGVVERTIRASLTKEGEKICLSESYVSPLVKKSRENLVIKLVVKNGEIEASFVE